MPYKYQDDFYVSSEGVRNVEGRLKKADKIARVLETFGPALLSTATCLDVGCSSGTITAALAPLFARVIGVEYDGTALQHRPSAGTVALWFVQGDAMRLPVANEVIDVVICAQVYEHVPDARQLAAEVFRVLKPGGAVFFSGPNKLFPLEPHYGLPFLHWLPASWADAYLSMAGKGNHYYERSRTRHDLLKILEAFSVRDLNPDLIRSNALALQGWQKVVGRIPPTIWRILAPLLPNFNWLLYKPKQSVHHR